MKTIIRIISLSAILAGFVLSSQESSRPQMSAEQRFKQWDRNGDGKLTPDEVPGERLVKMLDRNGDGVVTLEEAKAVRGGDRRAAKRQSEAVEELPPSEGYKPRQHGDEAKAAGLKLDVLAKLDIAMQQAVANKEVSGVVGLIHRNGLRGVCLPNNN